MLQIRERDTFGTAYFQVNTSNFLQNLEGKFTKSNSQSRALTHYPTGCLRRQSTPDFLFISSYRHCMDLADPCGNPSCSSQSFMHHQILCDLFHGIHGVQEMQVSVMMTHNTELVHRCAQVGTTWQSWQ